MKRRIVHCAGAWPILVAALAAICGCQMATEVTPPNEPARILLQDEFTDNANNWFTGAVPGQYEIAIADGEYLLRSLNDSGIVASKQVPLPEVGNFDLSASFQLHKTGQDLGYGLCWGGSDRDNRFCFFISADSQFTLFKREGGAIHEYVPWNKDPHLQPQANTVEIHKRGSTLRYLINGAQIGALPYEPFFGSRIYFAADGRQEVGVTSLLIRVE